jgi:ABC-type transport system involved in multi-copper enzyme maturation permease subunit
MSLSSRRVRAIVRKEIREYRRNRSLIAGMAILPLVFVIQPLIAVFALPASSSGDLAHEHVLLYLLGIPSLVPVFVAAYAVVGERQQGTLEPAMTTPIPGEEFLLGKALAALVPSLVIAYLVYLAFLAVVELFADPQITAALIQVPDLVAGLVFTPLLAIWSIWVGIAVSTRSSDVRVAQQVGLLFSLPPAFLAVAMALNVITPTIALAVASAVVLLVLDGLGWRLTTRLFDRERLIAGRT